MIALFDFRMITFIVPAGLFVVAGMLRPAFLPDISNAYTKDGKEINIIPTAERLFGIMSSIMCPIAGFAFFVGVSTSQTVLYGCFSAVLFFVITTTLKFQATSENK